jgi:hypothetical protein
MSCEIVFFILFALFFKHIVVDFPIYTQYVCRVRANSAELGWKLHNVAHGLFTGLILYAVSVPMWAIIAISLGEMLFHFIVDSFTVYCVHKCKTDPVFEAKWYWSTELDQFIHCLSYVGIAYLVTMIVA